MSKIMAALATVHNENTVALANLNFDFTLVKLEAPIEYTGLGQTISKRRKIDAEEGALHKTARRLAGLFGSSLPQTDDLFRAYGLRASEISSMSAINPREDIDKEGIFTHHVGADTASIWAAATSGSAAIALHLLAYMLARIFNGPEAISIWVEIVQKQKEVICGQGKNHLYSGEHQAAILATQQDISRTDLANWDASARAWLQSADQAKTLQHKQTMLILNNTCIPVNNEPETYASVMKAWKVAMEAMNNLVKGMPQRVHDGAALLAISAWHLYPDLAVYGSSCVEVKQKDPIFERAALLTLGLQQVGDALKSVYWSLPLACLQYYGHPVKASRTVGHENSRTTRQQFAYIVLGCLFTSWKDFAMTNDEGLVWIARLADMLELSAQNQIDLPRNLRWLTYVLVATRSLSNCEDSEKKSCTSTHESWPKTVNIALSPRICSHTTFRWSYASSLPVFVCQGREPRHVRWIKLCDAQLASCIRRSENFERSSVFIDGRAIDGSSLMSEEINPQSRSSAGEIAEDNEATELSQMRMIAQRRREIEELGEVCLPVAEVSGPKFIIVDEEDMDSEPGLIFSQEEDFLSAARDIRKRLIGPNPEAAAAPQIFYAGNAEVAALYSVSECPPFSSPAVSSKEMEEALSKINKKRLHSYLSSISDPSETENFIRNLNACVEMDEIYKILPGATISTLVVHQCLSRAKWVTNPLSTSTNYSLPSAFACIAMFESGTCNLDPYSLLQVFAMSSGNSLYVAGALLGDPYEQPSAMEIRRVVGNVGRSGITFLISPPEVKVRQANPEKWMAINHNKFDGKPENLFQTTSMHLSFTNYEMPLITEDDPCHIIDRNAVLVEALISIYDGSSWVAEVDILKTFLSQVFRVRPQSHSTHFTQDARSRRDFCYEEALQKHPQLTATSVENWDELIEAPQEGSIAVRAHKNWLARLALTALCVEQGFIPVILPAEICWMCCAAEYSVAKRYKKIIAWLLYADLRRFNWGCECL